MSLINKFYVHATALVTCFAIPTASSFAATCSCAGVPLANSITQSGTKNGQWLAHFNYSFHDINDLVQGKTEIEDQTGRKRETTSYIYQLSHGINDRWSITALGSYIEHVRNIAISNTNDEISSGVGDSMIAAIYTPKRITPFARNELAFGLGKKFATGPDGNSNNGIRYIEDMQPGTGAESTLTWAYYARAFSPEANSILFTSLSYTANKTNKDTYRFGDEINFSVGYNYQSSSFWQPGIALNYRKADAHSRGGATVPNTGGRWLDLSPVLQFNISENLAGRISGSIPIRRNLQGALQFTTRSTIGWGLSYQW